MSEKEPEKPLFDQWGPLKDATSDKQPDENPPAWVSDTDDWDNNLKILNKLSSEIEEETDGWDGTPQKESDFQKLRKSWIWRVLYHALNPVLTVIWIISAAIALDKTNIRLSNKLTSVAILFIIHLCLFVRLSDNHKERFTSQTFRYSAGCVVYMVMYIIAGITALLYWKG